jgi:LmbE family N-acetylglucosaminyl deacetylase
MEDDLRLLAVFAHPDDETLGVGGLLAKYAAEGARVQLVTATRGQLGWPWEDRPYPGAEVLGRLREAELMAAAHELGIQEVHLLDYLDGSLHLADQVQAARQVAARIRAFRPQVVVTFDPHGVYGHPDHIAICQITSAAVVMAASPPEQGGNPPHAVSKMYYLAEPQALFDRYQAIFGEITMEIDGVRREGKPWEAWAITTRIDCTEHWSAIWRAVACHQTQLPGLQGMLDLPLPEKQSLWAEQTLYRVFSRVPVSMGIERDIFDGLRGDPAA